MSVPSADRRVFIAERRAISVRRFDTILSVGYDEGWGAISPTHAAFVARLAGLVPPGRAVLDAACGTGKYWPALLAAGLKITGVDQSAAMLAHAHRKYPGVPRRAHSGPVRHGDRLVEPEAAAQPEGQLSPLGRSPNSLDCARFDGDGHDSPCSSPVSGHVPLLRHRNQATHHPNRVMSTRETR
jgi:SAM-dependent methyltransferase